MVWSIYSEVKVIPLHMVPCRQDQAQPSRHTILRLKGSINTLLLTLCYLLQPLLCNLHIPCRRACTCTTRGPACSPGSWRCCCCWHCNSTLGTL